MGSEMCIRDRGRDVRLIRECAERTGVNILVCSGMYWQEHPFYQNGVDAVVLADLMIREFHEGIQGTDIKPAFMKCATGPVSGTSESNKNMIRACAMAAIETGLPVYTHAESGKDYALFQQEILLKEGVAPEKIAFGHVFPPASDTYLKTLLADGSYIGCDQIGFVDNERVRLLAKSLAPMLKTDVRKKIFFSADMAVMTDWGLALTAQARDRVNNPCAPANRRKEAIFDALIPELLENGLTQEEVLEIFVDNPRRYFEG